MVPSPRPGRAFDLATVIDRLAAAGCVAPEEEAGELVGPGPTGPRSSGGSSGASGANRWRGSSGRPRSAVAARLVDPGVYVPRRQSEALARRAAGLLPAGGRAADLCTGAGAIAAHIAGEVPAATVVGTDVDPRAVACARRNGVAAVVADLGARCGRTPSMS